MDERYGLASTRPAYRLHATPANRPMPNGPACGRRSTNISASAGNAGSRMLSEPILTRTVSPSATPPSPARSIAGAMPRPRPPKPGPSANESASRHSPPNSSTWTSGSANGARDTYCSGSSTASTSAPAGAHRAPTSRPTRPAKDSTAQPPITGAISSAPGSPASHVPPASTSGSPGMNAGVIVPLAVKNPVDPKLSPGTAPNAAADAGIRADPCTAIQYPYCR